MSSQTFDGLAAKHLVKAGNTEIQLQDQGDLSIRSWIFVSSYGRHGQPQHGGAMSPAMLMDWTSSMSANSSYIRIIVIRGDEQQASFCRYDLSKKAVLQAIPSSAYQHVAC